MISSIKTADLKIPSYAEAAPPRIERADLTAEYPSDAPVPQLVWRVTFGCGEYGGSFGYGPTLREAIAEAAKRGWTPVRRYQIEIVLDRYDARLHTTLHTTYLVAQDAAYRGAQRMVDAACGAYHCRVLPQIHDALAKLRGEQATG